MRGAFKLCERPCPQSETLPEVLGEGAPNRSIILLMLTVFIGIEGAGVLLGYVLFRQFLGIVRS